MRLGIGRDDGGIAAEGEVVVGAVAGTPQGGHQLRTAGVPVDDHVEGDPRRLREHAGVMGTHPARPDQRQPEAHAGTGQI